MSTRSTSLPECPSCVTGKIGTIRSEIVAIKDANACNDNPECRCGCHDLWRHLREVHRPIGRP